jgi:hypothetical protein
MDKYQILDNNRAIPVKKIQVKQNIIMLRKVMEQQENMMLSLKNIYNSQKKLESTVSDYASTIGLLRQKILHMESKCDKLVEANSNRWF